MKKYAEGGMSKKERADYAKDLEDFVRERTYRPSVRETDSGKIVKVPKQTGMRKTMDDIGRAGLATAGAFGMPFAEMASGAVNVGSDVVDAMKGGSGRLRYDRSEGKKKGGAVKKAKGGYVRKADGVAQRGKTKGRFV